jgi:predicted choloylglycine hydrolase
MKAGGQRHAPAALPPGNTRYSFYRRMGGPQGRSGRVRTISPPPGFDPRTVQPVASRYTNWAKPAPVLAVHIHMLRELSSLDWAVWLVQDDFVTSDHEMSYCFVPTQHAYGACRVLTMRDVKMIICHFETKEIHVMCQDVTFQVLGSTLVHHNSARSWESALSSC